MIPQRSRFILHRIVWVLATAMMVMFCLSLYYTYRWRGQDYLSTLDYQATHTFMLAEDVADYLKTYYEQKASEDTLDINQDFAGYIVSQNPNNRDISEKKQYSLRSISTQDTAGVYLCLPSSLKLQSPTAGQIVAFTDAYYEHKQYYPLDTIAYRGLVFLRDGQFIPIAVKEKAAIDLIGSQTLSASKPNFFGEIRD